MTAPLPASLRVARAFIVVNLLLMALFLTVGAIFALARGREFIHLGGFSFCLAVASGFSAGLLGMAKRRPWGWWSSLAGCAALGLAVCGRTAYLWMTHSKPSLFLPITLLEVALTGVPLVLLLIGRRAFFEAARSAHFSME